MSDYNPDADPRSSNSLIRAYLASKGLQANGGNVRTALSGNAANPGMIPGLVNSTPSTEADDQAAMAAAAGRHGIGGNSGVVARAAPTRPELPDSAPGAETRVGGTGAGAGAGSVSGAPDTSAPPSVNGAPPTGSELSNALIAAAIASGVGGGGLLMRQLWQNRPPAAPARPAPIAGVDGQLPLPGGAGAAPPRQGDLSLTGGGPRVNQPELPLAGGAGPAQPDLFGPRVQPGPPVPPITVQANPGASIPVPEPAVVPPGPAPAPLPPQPIQTPDQFRAANPGTANVPPAEVAPNAPRARAPRARVPKLRL